jgi:hypothetical protein
MLYCRHQRTEVLLEMLKCFVDLTQENPSRLESLIDSDRIDQSSQGCQILRSLSNALTNLPLPDHYSQVQHIIFVFVVLYMFRCRLLPCWKPFHLNLKPFCSTSS